MFKFVKKNNDAQKARKRIDKINSNYDDLTRRFIINANTNLTKSKIETLTKV